jgi:hypothetical protein
MTITTGSVVITVSLNTLGEIHFTTPGRTTTDGGLTYTKTVVRNFSGELISFTDQSGNTDVQELAVTRIRPEVTLTYTPAGPVVITGDVDATISFSRPDMTIVNNAGSFTYTFTENGEFIFIYQDPQGFTGEKKAEVTRTKDLSSFITTRNVPSNNYIITVPSNGSVGYDYDIDWGDGSAIEHKTTGNPQHPYATGGNYQIKIRGKFAQLNFNAGTNASTMRNQIRSVDQWGKVQWQSRQSAFYGVQNLQILAKDTPNFKGVMTTQHMFYNASNLTGNFENWNLSGVTNTNSMFQYAYYFNSSLSGRDVHTVTDMGYMFYNSYTFDQDLSSWNPVSLTIAGYMLGYTALSTRNYNELLASRSKQPVKNNVSLYQVGGSNGGATMYGGCEVANGPAGISGHNILTSEKGWSFTDGGAGICPPAHSSNQLVFTRQVNGGSQCINSLYGNAGGNMVVIDWGDGVAIAPTLNGYICHGYPGDTIYEVRITHPEELTDLGLDGSNLKSLSLGDATNLTYLDLSNNYNPNI